MSKRSKSKISTDGASQAFASNPFEALNAGGLPSGPTSEQMRPKATDKKVKSKGRVEVRRVIGLFSSSEDIPQRIFTALLEFGLRQR